MVLDHVFVPFDLTPLYSWNIANIGAKHQSINQSFWFDYTSTLFRNIQIINTTKYHTPTIKYVFAFFAIILILSYFRKIL